MHGTYYNEIDKFAAQWLRNLIAAGHIAPGDVDERSIVDVRGDDLRGYTQCHFFAGIGVWSYALRKAGWPDDREVWTGSCPCQPFSAAGKGEGTADARHLWPEWFRLISQCRPVAIFGEQVAAAIRHGWLDAVYADLEGLDYALGSIVMGAHSVGAPHIRQRLYFVADHHQAGRGIERGSGIPGNGVAPQRHDSHGRGESGDVGDTNDARSQGRGERAGTGGSELPARAASASGEGLDYATGARRDGARQGTEGETRDEARLRGPERGRPTNGFWRDAHWLPCIDGKARPTKPGIFPLVNGYPNRVGILRAAGNAIVAETAAAFIRAYREVA